MNPMVREQLHKILYALEEIWEISCTERADSHPKATLDDIRVMCKNTLGEFKTELEKVVN